MILKYWWANGCSTNTSWYCITVAVAWRELHVNEKLTNHKKRLNKRIQEAQKKKVDYYFCIKENHWFLETFPILSHSLVQLKNHRSRPSSLATNGSYISTLKCDNTTSDWILSQHSCRDLVNTLHFFLFIYYYCQLLIKIISLATISNEQQHNKWNLANIVLSHPHFSLL